jgi:peroxiredoxin family protein
MSGEKVAIIINSASYERVEYALTVALSSAAVGKEVHILFTYGAVTRLKKGDTDKVGEETPEWVRKSIRIGLKKGSIQRVSELLKNLKRLEAKIYACVAAMALHNLTKDELVEEVDEVTGIVSFLESVEGALGIIYV